MSSLRNRTVTTVVLAFGLVAFISSRTSNLQAQDSLGSAFTYQGRLSAAGMPSEGRFDFQFQLYDAVQGGTLIGSVEINQMEISDGRITVSLDFGMAAFPGSARWLEVSVQMSDGGSDFTVLAPRQEVQATPYALHSIAASRSNQIVRTFSVGEGQTIRRGDVVGFSGNDIVKGEGMALTDAPLLFNELFGALRLTDSLFVIIGRSSLGTATAMVPEGDSFTFGSSVDFGIAVDGVGVRLSENQFVVAYRGADNSGTAVIGTVTGNTPSFGPASVFLPGPSISIPYAVTRLSDARFLLVYGQPSVSTAVVGTVTGDTVSFGPKNVLTDQPIAVAGIDSSTVVIARRNGTAVLGTISEGLLSIGQEETFSEGNNHGFALILPVTGAEFGLFYKDVTASPQRGRGVIGSVSGQSITFGESSPFSLLGFNALSGTTVDDDHFALVWPPGYLVQGEIIGTALRFGNVIFVLPGDSFSVSATTTGRLVIVTRAVSVLAGSVPLWPAIGVAQSDGEAGDLIGVILGGVSNVHDGIVPGRFYYAQLDGTISPEPSDFPLGLGLSTTEISLVGGLIQSQQ